MKLLPYTDEERELDEFAKTISFSNPDQVMEFCVRISNIGKRKWWAEHGEKYMGETTNEDRH